MQRIQLGILIPAFNEEKTIGRVLELVKLNTPKIAATEIIVVSDGSTDKTAQIALKAKVTVIEHSLNRGLGAALGTGFEYARKNNFDIVLTFDADLQHHPEDIWQVLKPIIYHRADVVIGSRMKNRKNMPWYRQVGIFGLNIITMLFFWVWTTDSQSGLRAFSKKALEKIDIQSNKMEVSSEFFYEIGRKNLRLKEVPIKSIYTDYSLTKGVGKGQVIHGVRIISKLIYRRFFSK